MGGGAAALLCSRNSRPAAFLLSLSSSERGGRRDCRAALEPELSSRLVHESRPRAFASGISTLASVAAYASCDAVSGRADQSEVCSALSTAIDSRLSHAAPSQLSASESRVREWLRSAGRRLLQRPRWHLAALPRLVSGPLAWQSRAWRPWAHASLAAQAIAMGEQEPDRARSQSCR